MIKLIPNTYTDCPPALIVASTTNRKHFNPEALQALSDNINARGIDQPIIVRALPGSRLADTFDNPPGMPKPAYEIVSGERRYRAACMAGLTHVPVILRVYTDVEAIEAQLIENMLRESLSELDEAEGFEVWLQQPGITTATIASKVEKSLRYVQSRLQLLDLQPETKQALRTDQIDVSRALLLAPVHDPKLQLKALDYASTAPAGGTKPSVRELQVWLQQNVMLALERAPFPIMLASLVTAAGACKPACPKRTGASPDIFEYVISADTCTDLICWKAKEDAHTAALQAKADKLGVRLVHGKEAKGICYEKSSTLRGYSPLSQVRNDLGSGLQGQRLDQLLGHSAAIPLPNAVLIENPFTRELITAVPAEEAEAALLAKGLLKQLVEPDIKADKAKSKKDFDADVAEIESKVNDLMKRRYVALSRAAVVASVMSTSEQAAQALLTPELLRAFVRAEIDLGIAHDALQDNALISVQNTDDLTDAQVCQAVALIMTFGSDECQQAYAVEHGIDTRAITKQATEQIKAEVAEQIAALRRLQKPPPPKSPLAQPSAAPVAHAENPKPKPVKAQAKAKLSAEDVQLGIAEAMQGIEAPPSDGAGALPPAALQFTKGQQVVVKTVSTQHAVWRQKYEGMTGTVKALNFDLAFNMALPPQSYEVTFKGRTGGVADFTADELEAVAA